LGPHPFGSKGGDILASGEGVGGTKNHEDWQMTNHKYSITGKINVIANKIIRRFCNFFSFSILNYVDKKDPMHRLGGCTLNLVKVNGNISGHISPQSIY
jgi:hypothetical protein